MGVTPICGGLLLLLWLRWCVRTGTKSQEPVCQPEIRNGDVAKPMPQRRQSIVIVEPSFYILKIINQLQYLWKGPDILRRAHIKKVPYAIRTPGAYQVQFSSREHIKQLVRAPDTYLSLHALARDMFQPKYTMNGLGFDDCMSANGSVHQRALQAELRSYLPSLTRPLNDCIVRTLTAEIYDNKPLAGEWRALEIFPMAKRLITAANALVFFGPEVSNDPIFLKAALEYPEHLMETAEVLRLLPSWIAPFAAPYLMRRHRALQILLDRLTPIVEARLQRTAPATENRDCIQFFINAAARKKQQDEWPVQRIIQVLLGIWFASVHQPAMCLFYALDDLCLHPEYTTALRDELDAAKAESPRDIASLSLLNGFLKESARLNPTDSISLRRKVLQPFTLDDGTMLAKGDIACVPLRPLLQDPDIYTEALTFNPYRFVNSGQLDKSKHSISTASDFTDADITFPIWGLGKRACPGRHYASHLLKLILAQILVHYDLKMADDSLHNKSRHFFWRSAIVPRARASLHFRERSIEISS